MAAHRSKRKLVSMSQFSNNLPSGGKFAASCLSCLPGYDVRGKCHADDDAPYTLPDDEFNLDMRCLDAGIIQAGVLWNKGHDFGFTPATYGVT
eukprot:3139888-Amphidinium_carterae.1